MQPWMAHGHLCGLGMGNRHISPQPWCQHQLEDLPSEEVCKGPARGHGGRP